MELVSMKVWPVCMYAATLPLPSITLLASGEHDEHHVTGVAGVLGRGCQGIADCQVIYCGSVYFLLLKPVYFWNAVDYNDG